MWVNIGDSYASSGIAGGNGGFNERWYGVQYASDKQAEVKRPRRELSGVPAKSLIGIPERFAIEMSNPNWVLRDDLTEEERIYVLTELTKRGIL